jgi:hypothetical protein
MRSTREVVQYTFTAEIIHEDAERTRVYLTALIAAAILLPAAPVPADARQPSGDRS